MIPSLMNLFFILFQNLVCLNPKNEYKKLTTEAKQVLQQGWIDEKVAETLSNKIIKDVNYQKYYLYLSRLPNHSHVLKH